MKNSPRVSVGSGGINNSICMIETTQKILGNLIGYLTYRPQDSWGQEYRFLVIAQIYWVKKTNEQSQDPKESFLSTSSYILIVSLLFNLPFPALCVTLFLTSNLLSLIPHFHHTYSPSFLLPSSFLLSPDYYGWSLVVFEEKDVTIDQSLSTTEHLLLRNTRNK